MKVLEGIKVLELGRVPPAELPGMMLADMGADVLKIDTPAAAGQSDAARSEAFSHTNRNKRSMALNLKAPEGHAIFLELAENADIVIEGFRPGVMKRLGADYESLRQRNPRLIFCSLSGFGQTGLYRDRPAHDLNFLALSGALSLWGAGSQAPDIPLNLVADYGGASMHGALAILMALFARERSGAGQYLDISYFESTVALLAATPNLRQVFSARHMPAAGEGVFCGGYPYYALYPTRDKQFLSVACSEPHLWRNFCEAIDRPSLAAHSRKSEHYLRGPDAAESAARREVGNVILGRECGYWEGYFAKLDVCIAPVKSIAQMLDDPHLRERGMFTSIAHPLHGEIPQFASALRLSETPAGVTRPAPATGEHTREVLASLGKSGRNISGLAARGVVG